MGNSNWADSEFYNLSLYHYQDKLITGNDLNVQIYLVRNIERDSFSQLKIQCSIFNTQTKKSIKFNLSYNEVFVLNQKLKTLIDNLNSIIEDINKNKANIKTQSIKLMEHNKMLYVSLMHKSEYNSVVVRICFADKEETTASEDKVYLDLLSFVAMLKLLAEFRDNYIKHVSDMHLYIRMSTIYKEISNLDNKIQNIQHSLKQVNSNNKESPQIENKPVEMQSDLDKFVDDKINDIKLDINIDNEIKKENKTDDTKKKVSLETSSKSFVEIFLNNNIINLEKIVQLALTAENPFDVINGKITFEYQKLFPNFNLYPFCECSEYNKLTTLINSIVRYHIKKLTINGSNLPSSIVPIYYNVDPAKIQNENLDIVYDLLLIFTYYTQLKNSLQETIHDTHKNKEYQCFLIKTLLSPLVFTYLSNEKISTTLNKEVFIAEILRRYRSYNEKGYFKDIRTELETYQFKNNIDENVIKSALDKLLNAYLPNYKNYQIDTTIEKYTKLGALQDSTPVISEQNSNNLKRYIQENQKDLNKNDQELINRILEKIEISYQDLKNQPFDYSNLSEEILKAICCWDIQDKNIIINYNYFIEKIKNSSLTKSMCISILHNLKELKIENFTNCLEINLV